MTPENSQSTSMWDGSGKLRDRRDANAHSESTTRRAGAAVSAEKSAATAVSAAQTAGAADSAAPPAGPAVRVAKHPAPRQRIGVGDSPFPPDLLDPIFKYEIPTISKQETAEQLHPHLLAAARIDTQIERAIGWLLHMLNQGVRVQQLGYARLSDYVRERMGFSVRNAQMLIRFAKELQRLPHLARAHARGDLKTSKVYCLLDVVRPENEMEWIERAQSMTVRKLKEAVQEEHKKQASYLMPGMGNSIETDDSSKDSSEEACSEELDAKLDAMLQETIDKMNQSYFNTITGIKEESKVHLNFRVPAAVAHLYDYSIDLARRASGSQAPQYSCFEFMLGEYLSGISGRAAGNSDDAMSADADAELRDAGTDVPDEGAASPEADAELTDDEALSAVVGHDIAADTPILPLEPSNSDHIKEWLEKTTNQWRFLPKEKVHYQIDPALTGGDPALADNNWDFSVDKSNLPDVDSDGGSVLTTNDPTQPDTDPAVSGTDLTRPDVDVVITEDADDFEDYAMPPLTDPFEIDRALRRLVRFRQNRHADMAVLLSNFRWIGCPRACQFLSFDHYCTEGLGISPRFGRDLANTYHQLWSLPLLRKVFVEGRLTWSKTRLLAGICQDHTVAAWIARASEVTVRRLELEVVWARRQKEEDLCAWHRDGGPPPLSFLPPRGKDSSVRPGFGLWEKPADELGAHTFSQPGAAEQSDQVGQADQSNQSDQADQADQTDDPNDEPENGDTRTFSQPASDLPCFIHLRVTPEVASLYDEVRRYIEIKAGRILQPWETLLHLLRKFLEVWDDERLARQATEYKILERDGWQCAAPGCSARRGLEVHHIIPRSQGGSDDPKNTITLCSVHHRGIVHEHRMSCEGEAPDQVVYEMGCDRTLCGILNLNGEKRRGRMFRGDVRIHTGLK